MPFEDLRAFTAVARLRSMSRAALMLDTTQSTVSKRVQRLEELLNLQLVDRQTRPIGLTVEGRSFHRLVSAFLEGADALSQGSREQRHVSLAVAPIIISHGLVPVVGAFRAAHPEWQLSIVTSTAAAATARQLREGTVDVWLAITEPGMALGNSEDISYEPFYASDRVLIMPKGHPLAGRPLASLAELAPYPLITRLPDTPTRKLLEEEFERAGAPYNVVLELDDMEAVKRYVAFGLGISVVLDSMIEREDTVALAVAPLRRFLPPLQMSLATLRGRALPEPAKRFIEILKATMGPASQAAKAGVAR